MPPRKAPLNKGDAQLSRETPLAKRNPERKARLFEEQFGSVAFVKWVRLQECAVCGSWPSEAAHATSRGAGGKADDILPLCPVHHHEQHQHGVRTFEKAHGIDMKAKAAETFARWQEVAA